jgi:predicted XRE-type DNA-binding protein
MKKTKVTVTHSAEELAEFLGLPASEGIEIKIRSDLNDKIIKVVERKGLTHAQVAKLAGTSRTRVTALLNRNTQEISTDLMLRVLGSLGVKAKIVFQNAA